VFWLRKPLRNGCVPKIQFCSNSAYSGYAPRISLPPYSQLTGIQIVVDDLANTRPDAKGKNAQQFVDEEILRELDKEGVLSEVREKQINRSIGCALGAHERN
jgi:hypothetical protein